MSGKLNLSRITYLGIVPRDIVTENNSIEKVLKIGHKTSQNIEFYDKILYTAQEPNCETYDFKIVKITPLEFEFYTDWLYSNLGNLFESDFMINFHGDGMIQNPLAWTDEFLDYDYIGASWPENWNTNNGGNGGFSLRSKRLCELINEIYLRLKEEGPLSNEEIGRKTRELASLGGSPNDIFSWENAEDYLICIVLKDYLEERGVKFCPKELSCRFSTERFAIHRSDFFESFGFHEINELTQQVVTGNPVFVREDPHVNSEELAEEIKRNRLAFIDKALA